MCPVIYEQVLRVGLFYLSYGFCVIHFTISFRVASMGLEQCANDVIMTDIGNWVLIQYKMSSYQYRKSRCGDKTVERSSYIHNGISYTYKMVSLYWINSQTGTKLQQSAPSLSEAHYLHTLFWHVSTAINTMWCPTFIPKSYFFSHSLSWLLKIGFESYQHQHSC